MPEGMENGVLARLDALERRVAKLEERLDKNDEWKLKMTAMTVRAQTVNAFLAGAAGILAATIMRLLGK